MAMAAGATGAMAGIGCARPDRCEERGVGGGNLGKKQPAGSRYSVKMD